MAGRRRRRNQGSAIVLVVKTKDTDLFDSRRIQDSLSPILPGENKSLRFRRATRLCRPRSASAKTQFYDTSYGYGERVRLLLGANA